MFETGEHDTRAGRPYSVPVVNSPKEAQYRTTFLKKGRKNEYR